MTTDAVPRAEHRWAGLTGADRHAACVLAARTGDRRAMEVLVAELTPLIWHVVRGKGLDRPTAEDVVQTVWLTLLRHLHRLAEPRAVAAWLATTARREASRVRRATPPPAELPVDLPDNDPTPDAALLRDERNRQLWAAFRRLPRRCQELLRMSVLADHPSYRTIAETLRMPHGSIGPTRARCLRTLHRLLEEEKTR